MATKTSASVISKYQSKNHYIKAVYTISKPMKSHQSKRKYIKVNDASMTYQSMFHYIKAN